MVSAHVTASGRGYVTASADKNGLANRRILAFAEATLCNYDDDVAFTLVQNQAEYDMRSTTPFAKAMAVIRRVVINGTSILDQNGEPGLITLPELEDEDPVYDLHAAGMPSRACMVGRQQLRLYPKPDQIYTSSYVSGWTLPTAIDTTSGGDSTAIDIPDEYLDLCAAYVASYLMAPAAATESDFMRLEFLGKHHAREFKELRAKARLALPYQSRRSRTDTSVRSLA